MSDNVEGIEGVSVVRLGQIPYREALELQRGIHAERVAGDRGDTLLLLTHPPVITLGRGSDPAHLLLSPEEYTRRGVEVIETDRGGDVTWHGPGQLVGYPIVDLRARGLGPRTFLRALEESLILLLAEYGLSGTRMAGLTGVWLGQPGGPARGPEKVAAIGIRVARGVTLHGFALNVTTDPRSFDLIVPCGIRDHGVTSLDRHLEVPVDVEDAVRRYPAHLGSVLGDRRRRGLAAGED